jgi:glycosyltransferase involved in cell wall biosynthesis
VTKASLRPACRTALRLDKTSKEPMADHVFLAEQVFQDAEQFDVVHSHIDYIAFPLLRRMNTAHVTTIHGRLDIPNLYNLTREFSDEPVISVSKHQQSPLPWANWQGTVPHGVPENFYSLRKTPGRYLAFLGRISPEKRVDRAIEIATRAGLPLKIAAKLDKPDRDYYEATIKPLLQNPDIEYIGEIGEAEKDDFLGNAYALLFPIDWPEPFGLVMIEAMACGTPVIACPCGSVPEIVEHGTTGFLVNDVDEAVEAVAKVPLLSRKGCRQRFEQRFTAMRMAREYVRVFEQLIPAKSMARSSAGVL